MECVERVPCRQLYPLGVFDRDVHLVVATTRKPLSARPASLPDVHPHEGTSFPLQQVAREAALRAVFAGRRYDWLVVLPEGRDAMKILLAPFLDIVPDIARDWT